jgi:3-oxoacyl-[acyl-carrier-protein] synthase-1
MLAALAEGRSGLGPSPLEVGFPTAVGAVRVPLPALPPELAVWDTRQTRMAVLLALGIADEVARVRRQYGAARIGVLLGTSTAGIVRTEAAHRHLVEHGALPHDYDFFRQHSYGATGTVVREVLGLKGPTLVVSTACSSSAKVLATAARLMDADVIDAAVVGGVDTLCYMTLRGFHALGVLSDEPCQPFSRARKGISIGEGGAFLLMQRKGDGRALLLGAGESSDAHHMSAPHPEGAGARAAMTQALAQGGLAPHQVQHVNAHATATALNDSAEAAAIGAVFGREVLVAGTKGYTGHTLGAAGATEAVLSILALEEGWVPPSIGCDPPDESLPITVTTRKTTAPIRAVVSNSFAFGGNNVSLLLGAPA